MSTPTLTREQRRSRAYHTAAAAALRADPERVLCLARRNLQRLRAMHPHAERTFSLWEHALSLPVDELAARLVANDADASEMRHVTPLAGALSARERTDVLRSFRVREKAP